MLQHATKRVVITTLASFLCSQLYNSTTSSALVLSASVARSPTPAHPPLYCQSACLLAHPSTRSCILLTPLTHPHHHLTHPGLGGLPPLLPSTTLAWTRTERD